MKLTSAQIRYFLAVYSLSGSGGVRSADIADSLEVTRPSVHRMMEQLTQMGLLEKERYSSVRLTENGYAIAKQYLEGFSLISGLLDKSLGLPPDSAGEGALAILGSIETADLRDFCTKKQNTAV